MGKKIISGITRAEYNSLFNEATQITVAFTQQATALDNDFNDGRAFGKFWGECLAEMAKKVSEVQWNTLDKYDQHELL